MFLGELICQELSNRGLELLECDQFNEWAFGPDYIGISSAVDAMERWNFLHSHQLLLTLDGIIQYDIEKMVNLWKSRENHPDTESTSQRPCY